MKHGAMAGGRRRTVRAVLTALVSLTLVTGATSSVAGGLDDEPAEAAVATTAAARAEELPAPDVADLAEAPAAEAPSAEPAAVDTSVAEGTAVEIATPQATARSTVSTSVGGELAGHVPAPLSTSEPATYCNPQPGKLLSYEHKRANGGGWTSGNLLPGYSEGDWIPQRAELDLRAGWNEIVVSFDMNDGSVYGYDDLRVVGLTRSAGGSVVLGADAVRVAETVTGPATARTTTVTMRFDVATSAEYHLLWDVHVASALDWGAGRGAGSYSGSSLHTRTVELNCVKLGSKTLPAPFGKNGIEYGTLTVDKVTDPAGSPQVFSFRLSGPGYEGEGAVVFTLSDIAAPWTSQLPTETFTISEVDLPPGWELTDLACSGTTAVYAGTSATFTVADRADIRCSFTNSQIREPGIEIVKQAWGTSSATALGGAHELPAGATVKNNTTLTWTYTVRNTGQTVLLDVVVTDRPTVHITCPSTRLEAGERMVCSGSAAVSPRT